MTAGAAPPGARNRAQRRDEARKTRSGFNADERGTNRDNLPVTIAGVTFTRRRKSWKINKLVRTITRDQEAAVAKGMRLRARIAELEVEQLEAASDGNAEQEAELETKIGKLIEDADGATELAELTTYRLVALLLVPPPLEDGQSPDADGAIAADGWGPRYAGDVEHSWPAIEFLQGDEDDEDVEREGMDVEDVAALAMELTGSVEADPQTASESG